MRTKTAVDLYTRMSFSFFFFALSPCSYVLSTLSRSRFARLHADFRIEKENNVCLQARLRRSDPRPSEIPISKLTDS